MSKQEISLSKRKSLCEKEILDFFFFIEDRLASEPQIIEQFTSAVEEFNSQK